MKCHSLSVEGNVTSSPSALASAEGSEGSRPTLQKFKKATLRNLVALSREARQQGWQTVDPCTLVPRVDLSSSVCTFRPFMLAAPAAFTRLFIFRRLMQGLVARVVAESNQVAAAVHVGPSMCRLHTTERELWAFIAVLLRIMATKRFDEIQVIRDDEFSHWNFLSIFKTERLFYFLSCSYGTLVSEFNDGLRSMIQAGGVSCIDENIFPWLGHSPFLVHIPTKPHRDGLRCFVHAFKLTASGFSIPLRIMPELCRPAYSVAEILDTFVQQPYPASYSLSTDSYFASLEWMVLNSSIPTYQSLTLPHFPLLPLFTHNLQFRHYRIFRRGSVYVSVWHGDDYYACATNAYSEAPSLHSVPRPLPLLGQSFSTRPTLPLLLVPSLEKATLDDVKQLAHALALPTGGTKSELAFRICGYPSPLPLSSSSVSEGIGSASPSSASSTVTELKSVSMKLGQHITGNKEQLQRRLHHARTNSLSIPQCESELQAFLGVEFSPPPDTAPVINAYYENSYRLVDQFDQFESALHYHPRIRSEFNRVFFSLVQMAATTTYLLCKDNHARSVRYPPCSETCGDFGNLLAFDLMDFARHHPF